MNFTENVTDYPMPRNNSDTNSSEKTVDYLITKEQYELSRMVIYLVILPIISVIGISGNSMSLYILNKYPTNHTFCTYLKALTGVDVLLLSFAFVRFIFKVLELAGVGYGSKIETYVTYYTSLIIGSVAIRLSSSLIAIISMERLMAVAFPFRCRSMAIETRPLRFILAVILFHCCLQIPTFILVQVEEVNMGVNVSRYVISRTILSAQISAFTNAYLFFIAVIGGAFPVILVIICTGCIIIQVFKKKSIDTLKTYSGSLEKERMTLTLVVMATLFTILYMPMVATYILSAFENSEKLVYFKALLNDVNIALVCTNSATDFIVYLLTSIRFRALFLEQINRIFKCEKGESQGNEGTIQTISAFSRNVSGLENRL